MSQLNPQELTRKFFVLEACIDCLLKKLIAATHYSNIYRGRPTRQGGFQWGPYALI